MFVNRGPKSFRSQSNKFFSTTEVSARWETFWVYEVHVSLCGVFVLPAQRKFRPRKPCWIHVIVQCGNGSWECMQTTRLRRKNVWVLFRLWRDDFSFMSTNWQQCSLLLSSSLFRGVFVDEIRCLVLCVDSWNDILWLYRSPWGGKTFPSLLMFVLNWKTKEMLIVVKCRFSLVSRS